MTRLVLRSEVLRRAADFFQDLGAHGCEGTAMIAGRIDAETAYGDRLVIPAQISLPSPFCSVEVTTKGKLELAAALEDSEVYVCRIHSHPDSAFHSRADDENPILTAEGAWSIVAPNFGLDLHDGLTGCAIHCRVSNRWRRLTDDEVDHFIEVC